MDGDVAARRAVLLSARIRFSPEVQTLRETALDKMVEQTLLLSDRLEGLAELHAHHQSEAESLDRERSSDATDKSNRIAELERRLAEGEARDEHKRQRRSATRRVSLVVLVACLGELAAIMGMNHWGKGDNLYQKVLAGWPIILAVLAAAGFLGTRFIGRRRLEALGWIASKK